LTGQSRGFAFIQFTSRDATLDAMRAMDGAEINGQRISVVLAKPPPGRPRGKQLTLCLTLSLFPSFMSLLSLCMCVELNEGNVNERMK
jgi:RNA recognition motif-containing protein